MQTLGIFAHALSPHIVVWCPEHSAVLTAMHGVAPIDAGCCLELARYAAARRRCLVGTGDRPPMPQVTMRLLASKAQVLTAVRFSCRGHSCCPHADVQLAVDPTSGGSCCSAL